MSGWKWRAPVQQLVPAPPPPRVRTHLPPLSRSAEPAARPPALPDTAAPRGGLGDGGAPARFGHGLDRIRIDTDVLASGAPGSSALPPLGVDRGAPVFQAPAHSRASAAIPSTVQARLEVGRPNDPAETEAERFADSLQSGGAATPVSESAPVSTEPPPGDEAPAGAKVLTMKGDASGAAFPMEEEAAEVSARFQPGASAPEHTGGLESRLARSSGGGTPLRDVDRARFEPALGADLSGVRVHTGTEAAAMSSSFSAQAFTRGRDIYFASGRYAPGDAQGQHLLAHELAHVVQQGATGSSAAGLGPVQRKGGGKKKAAKAKAGGSYGPFHVKIPGRVDGMELAILTCMQVFGLSRKEAADLVISEDIFVDNFKLSDEEVKKGISDVTINSKLYDAVMLSKSGASDEGERKKKAAERKAQLQKGAEEKKKATREQVDQEFEKRTGRKPPGKKGSKEDQDLYERVEEDVLNAQEKAARARLDALPEEVKALILRGGKVAKPSDYEQIARIGEKLAQLSPQDLSVYALVAKQMSEDLNQFEKSVDVFIQVRKQIAEGLAQAAKQPAAGEKKEDDSIEAASKKAWEGFDPKQLEGLNETQKRDLARSIAWKESRAQMKHMVSHPGQTALGMGRSLVRVDEMAGSIADDVKAAADGDRNAYSRWASGLGAGAKTTGWLAGALGAVAAAVYVGILFVPGLNAVQLAATALALGVGAVLLSAGEYELRIRAAGEAKSEKEFREEVDKAAAAGTNAIVGAAMLAAAVAIKFIARTPLPGRLQNVSNAIRLASEALAKTPKGAAFFKWRGDLLFSLRQKQAGLWEALGVAKKSLAEQAKALEGIKSGQELADRLAAGDKALSELTGISKEQGQTYQKLAATPEGRAALERLRQELMRAVHDAPAMAEKQVSRADAELKKLIEALEKAQEAEAAKAALANAEKNLSPDEVGKQITADQEAYVQGRLKEAAAATSQDAAAQGGAGQKPVAEAKPAGEKAPAEAKPAGEKAPAAEKTPVEEQAPAEKMPTEEQAPVAEKKPAEEQAPSSEKKPAEEQAPPSEKKPAEEQAPPSEKTPAEEQAPVSEKKPVEEKAPAEQKPAAAPMSPEAAAKVWLEQLQATLGSGAKKLLAKLRKGKTDLEVRQTVEKLGGKAWLEQEAAAKPGEPERPPINVEAEAKARATLDKLEERLSPDAREQLNNIRRGAKSDVGALSTIEKLGGEKGLEATAQSQAAQKKAAEATAAKSAGALPALKQRLLASGFLKRLDVLKLLTGKGTAAQKAANLKGLIAEELALAEVQGQFKGQSNIRILRSVRVIREQPFKTVEEFMADFAAKNPGKKYEGTAFAKGGKVYTVSTDIDILVVEDPPGGGRSRIRYREEIKSGHKDTPGQAKSQLDTASERFKQAAQGDKTVRFEASDGTDITDSLDLASDATADKAHRGPANSGKEFNKDVGVTTADLEKLAKELVDEFGASQGPQTPENPPKGKPPTE